MRCTSSFLSLSPEEPFVGDGDGDFDVSAREEDVSREHVDSIAAEVIRNVAMDAVVSSASLLGWPVVVVVDGCVGEEGGGAVDPLLLAWVAETL